MRTPGSRAGQRLDTEGDFTRSFPDKAYASATFANDWSDEAPRYYDSRRVVCMVVITAVCNVEATRV